MNVITPDSANYAQLNSAMDQARAGSVRGFDYVTFLRLYNGADLNAIIQAEYESENLSNFRSSLRARGLEADVDYAAQLVAANGKTHVLVRRQTEAVGRIDRLPRTKKTAAAAPAASDAAPEPAAGDKQTPKAA